MAPPMEKRRNMAHTVYTQHMIAPEEPGAWLNADRIQAIHFRPRCMLSNTDVFTGHRIYPWPDRPA